MGRSIVVTEVICTLKALIALINLRALSNPRSLISLLLGALKS